MKRYTNLEILTELEAVEALLNADSMRALGLDVLAEELARRDALPLKVLGKRLQVLLSAGTGSAKEEDAANYDWQRNTVNKRDRTTYLGSS